MRGMAGEGHVSNPPSRYPSISTSPHWPGLTYARKVRFFAGDFLSGLIIVIIFNTKKGLICLYGALDYNYN